MSGTATLDDIASLDATAQAELVRTRRISALELVEAAIARLERDNPALNAVVRTDFERARERAKLLEGGGATFAGVPILLKDIGAEETRQVLSMGMRVLRDFAYRPRRDSYIAQKLRAAGFIPLGRTNMPELAILPTTEPDAFGPTRNPWNREHSAGGSSGGSAAAVAAGIVPVAHATDGGGSIRGPASMCGLLGLKPSRGRCSFGPNGGERWSSLSTQFALARSVRDCAALLDHLASAMPGDPYHAPEPATPYSVAVKTPPPRLRIAVFARGVRDIALDPACADATLKTAKALEALGHQVEEAYPRAFDESNTPKLWVAIVAANIAHALSGCEAILGRPITAEDVEPLTFALAERGRAQSAVQHIESVERMHAFGRRLCAFFEDYDLLLTPTQAAPPPRLGELTAAEGDPLRAMRRSPPFGVFTLPFNMSGQPAISVPAGRSERGLPLGVQLAAAYGREDLLLKVAAQLEQARPWPVTAVTPPTAPPR